MRIIFMGTPKLSAVIMRALIDAGHEVALAVTQPDRPGGRGMKLKPSPVKECAAAHGIPVFQPERIRDPKCVEILKEVNADITIVAAFGQILPGSLLYLNPYGSVNVHASLLPRYRGAAPIQRAIIDGERITGVTVMQMDEGLDTGDILLSEEIRIEERETAGSLSEKIAGRGAALCLRTLDGLLKGEITPRPQDGSLASYAKMISRDTGKINWAEGAAKIDRLIRGLNPKPGAYTYLNGSVLKIREAIPAGPRETSVPEGPGRCEKEGPGSYEEAKRAGEVACGTVISANKDSFDVLTGDGILRILRLQPAGKKRMDAGAFLRGYHLKEGERLVFK